MNIISQIIEVLRTNKRHKGYEKEIKLAKIERISVQTFGTTIKAQNDDWNYMFKDV